MTAPKAPPTRPVLENFYTVAQAAVRLNLREPEDPSKKGEKWLRDGVNKEDWPHRRMANQLQFSDSDLAWIANHCLNKPRAKSGTTRARRRRRTPAVK
ncbi:hypothetical protein [Streptomyces violascens]|uniref:hypothetical protein n=1 Tax=Streptomyces violascens TaxID=67381 RepID=UPI00367AA462